MKALVTGSAGFIGSSLVKGLLAQGHRVRCLVHHAKERLDGLDVEITNGSITQRKSLAEAMEGVDVVFHLAALASDWGSKERFVEINALGTQNILHASVDAGVRRVVHMSSLAVHRFNGYLDADENTPADQDRYAYGASKVAAEKIVGRFQNEGNIETVRIRPGLVILGPEDTTAFVHMAPLLSKGRWTHVARGRTFLCYSYVENLVDGLILAGEKPEAAGEIFIITDDIKIRWREFISGIIKAFGVKERSLSVPAPLARVGGITLEALARLFGSKNSPPVNDYRTALVARDYHFSCAKAKRVLGYRPKVSLEEGLRRTVAWYWDANENGE
jgi:nucleoside-diphosphate-sugar epimerase